MDQSVHGLLCFLSMSCTCSCERRESLLESWSSSQCAAGGRAPQIRVPCVYRTEREGETGGWSGREGLWHYTTDLPIFPSLPSLAPWACACVGAADCKNEGWEKKGIGKGRGQWVGRAQNTPLRHPHNIGGRNHVRMIQYEFSWRIQNCWKHYCKFAVVWLKGQTPQFLVKIDLHFN